MSDNKKDFPSGIYFNEPHSKAPDFVIWSIAIKNDQIDFGQIKKYCDSKWYTKLDIKKSKEWKVYMEFNTYWIQEKSDMCAWDLHDIF